MIAPPVQPVVVETCATCPKADFTRLTNLLQQFERTKDSRSLSELVTGVIPCVNDLDKHPLSSSCIGQRCDLDALWHLIRSRANYLQHPQLSRSIISETNQLYKQGLGNKLFAFIRAGLTKLKETCEKDKAFVVIGSSFDTNLRKAADTIFFMFYGTQIEDSEVHGLIDLLRFVSELLMDTGLPVAEGNGDVEHWKTCAYAVLAIIQMAHAASLDQFVPLLLRTIDDVPSNGRENADLNLITQTIGMDISWRSKGAKGLACLVNAVLRQPLVDNNEIPAAEVIKLLIQATELRAYSYIRLCLLPMLQSNHVQDNDEHCYINTLCELMLKLAYIFRTYDEAQHIDRGRYFLQPADLAVARSGSPDGLPMIRADCVDDVLHCYAALFALRPSFAEQFVVKDEEGEGPAVATAGGSGAVALPAVPKLQLHTFIEHAVMASDRQPCLLLSSMRILAAVARGVFNTTAPASYNFLSRTDHGHGLGAPHMIQPRRAAHPGHPPHTLLSWDYFFKCIGNIAQRMNPTAAMPPGLLGHRAHLAAMGAVAGAVGVRAEPLSAKDEEGLIAIIDLIASCAEHPLVAAQFVAKYHPVKLLFDLLVCPVSTKVKGAIFKALASFVKSSTAETYDGSNGNPGGLVHEVWTMIEDHRLLPAKHTGGYSVYPDNRTDVSRFEGVRFELEKRETADGFYPCTEGFLILLDALLSSSSHGGSGWCVDTLGTGYRRPGLMPYFEFVMDDVLLCASKRSYLGCEEGMMGHLKGQRWRLTARALRVIIAILQNYEINQLPFPLQSSFTPIIDTALEQLSLDFREEQAEYLIEGQTSPVRCDRQKTVGFTVMALMLGRTRLLECVLLLLQECSLRELDDCKIMQGIVQARIAVSIFGKMQEPFRPPLPGLGPGAPAGGPGLAGGGGFMGGHQPFWGGMGVGGDGQEIDLEQDLSLIGLDEGLVSCDGAYWREKVVTECMGLLYECALREQRFLEHLRAAPPLTIIRCEDGRIAHVPVMVQGYGGMSEVLSSSLVLGTIAHFLGLPSSKWHSLPCVPVLSARLLEHVAVQQTPEAFLWALKSASEDLSHLTTACVKAIVEGHEGESATERGERVGVKQHHQSMGADPLPDIFTLGHTSDRPKGGSWVNTMHQQINAIVGQPWGDVTTTTRAAVLSLLLRTLSLNAERPGLAHELLGIRAAMDEVTMLRAGGGGVGAAGMGGEAIGGVGTGGVYLSPLTLPSPNPTVGPVNCLQAIVQLITTTPRDPSDATVGGGPEGSGGGGDYGLIPTHPELACTCFELLYRLCASPASSTVTLGYLRRRVVHFFPTQIHFLCDYLSRFSDDDLEGLCGKGALDETKAARHNCTAWLLRMFAIELRTVKVKLGYSAGKMAEMFDWLLAPGAAQRAAVSAVAGGQGISLSPDAPLVLLLKMAVDLPTVDLSSLHPNQHGEPPLLSSPLVRGALTDASVPYSISRCSPVGSSESGFFTIDLKLFEEICKARAGGVTGGGGLTVSTLKKEEYNAGVDMAVSMNVYNKRAAAATHLCQAWSQVIEIATFPPNMLGQDQYTAGAIRRMIKTVALPTLQLLTSTNISPMGVERGLRSSHPPRGSPLEPVMVEQLVRPLPPIIDALCKAQALSLPHTRSTLLSPEEHERLLMGLCYAALRPATGGAASSSTGGSSATTFAGDKKYRGMLYTCITKMLYLSMADPSSNRAPFPLFTPALGGQRLGGEVPWTSPQEATTGERKDSGEYVGTGVDRVGGVSMQDCRARSLMVIEPLAGDLADLLGTDAFAGPAIWRISALAALTALLTALSPTRGQAATGQGLGQGSGEGFSYPHHGYAQALRGLVHRGHLVAVLEYVGPVDAPPLRTATTTTRPGRMELGVEPSEGVEELLFTSAVSLCVALASTPIGAAALLDAQFLPRIVALPFFRYPPPSVEEILPFGPDGSAMREEMGTVIETRLAPVLRALRCLCSAVPTHDVLHGTALFLHTNQRTVSFLLRLRLQTVNGLELTEGLVALLVAVAAAPLGIQDYGSTKNGIYMGPGSGLTSANKQPRLNDHTTSPFPTGSSSAAASSSSSYTSTLRDGSSAGEGGGSGMCLWETVLGGQSAVGEGFTSDVCALLRLLSNDPLPSAIITALSGNGSALGLGLGLGLRGVGDHSGTSKSTNWWSRFPPTNEEEEASQQRMVGDEHGLGPGQGAAVGVTTNPVLAQWTLFDQRKADTALRMLSLCAVFLRVRVAACLHLGQSQPSTTDLRPTQHSTPSHLHQYSLHGGRAGGGSWSSGLLAVDIDAVMMAFCRCAELAYALEANDTTNGGLGLPHQGGVAGGRAVGGGMERPFDSTKALLLPSLLATLRLTIDNLICVIHNMHLASTTEERAGWYHGLQKCLDLATDARLFAPQSLVGKVGQWLKDHVEYTQT